MKIDVYDTYYTSPSGQKMHFDVLAPTGTAAEAAFGFAKKWLASIGQDSQALRQERCAFCHSENASPHVEKAIEQSGYFILQMEGCPDPFSF